VLRRSINIQDVRVAGRDALVSVFTAMDGLSSGFSGTVCKGRPSGLIANRRQFSQIIKKGFQKRRKCCIFVPKTSDD